MLVLQQTNSEIDHPECFLEGSADEAIATMGRRDHLIRIALAAHQFQIEEPITPTESEDVTEEQLAAAAKKDKIERLDVAQEAVLSAIGFMSGAERKQVIEQKEKDIFSISTACGLINYHLPLPVSCQRYQVMVGTRNIYLIVEYANFRHFDTSISRICHF